MKFVAMIVFGLSSLVACSNAEGPAAEQLAESVSRTEQTLNTPAAEPGFTAAAARVEQKLRADTEALAGFAEWGDFPRPALQGAPTGFGFVQMSAEHVDIEVIRVRETRPDFFVSELKARYLVTYGEWNDPASPEWIELAVRVTKFARVSPAGELMQPCADAECAEE